MQQQQRLQNICIVKLFTEMKPDRIEYALTPADLHNSSYSFECKYNAIICDSTEPRDTIGYNRVTWPVLHSRIFFSVK